MCGALPLAFRADLEGGVGILALCRMAFTMKKETGWQHLPPSGSHLPMKTSHTGDSTFERSFLFKALRSLLRAMF
jgi:hypothetical protein